MHVCAPARAFCVRPCSNHVQVSLTLNELKMFKVERTLPSSIFGNEASEELAAATALQKQISGWSSE